MPANAIPWLHLHESKHVIKHGLRVKKHAAKQINADHRKAALRATVKRVSSLDILPASIFCFPTTGISVIFKPVPGITA